MYYFPLLHSLYYVMLCNSVLEYAHPFERIIQQEELWLYKHPHKEHDTVPTSILFVRNSSQIDLPQN